MPGLEASRHKADDVRRNRSRQRTRALVDHHCTSCGHDKARRYGVVDLAGCPIIEYRCASCGTSLPERDPR